uniref:Uncharacterized protein n=1 Tax=Meloidogyne javanica TaxID=6303 RepID=A0A915N7G7_MELJA
SYAEDNADFGGRQIELIAAELVIILAETVKKIISVLGFPFSGFEGSVPSFIKLNGQVHVGSLLSSVSFLRQMALPTLTIALQIDNQTSPKTSATTNNDFNVVQVGEIVCVSISIYFSIGGTLTGELSLGCYQNFQDNTNTNNNTSIEHPDKFFIFGPNCLPIEIEGVKKQREDEEEKEFVGEGREEGVIWTKGLVTGSGEKLREAENFAKQRRVRIWKNFNAQTTSVPSINKSGFSAKVVEIDLCDSLSVLKDNGEELKAPRTTFIEMKEN